MGSKTPFARKPSGANSGASRRLFRARGSRTLGMESRECQSTSASSTTGVAQNSEPHLTREQIMAHHDDDIRKLERILTESYRSHSDRSNEVVDVTQSVMRDVRRSDRERAWWTPFVVLDQLVWRTATITAAVVVMMTMLLTVDLFRPQSGETQSLIAEELESVPFGD